MLNIDIRARNVQLTNQLRETIDRHFGKIDRKVSPLATLHVELHEERNPAIAENQVADVRIHLKGKVLRAHASDYDLAHAVELAALKLDRQVERYRERRHHLRRHALERMAS